MPRISYFYGVSVYIYYHDHAPPHFHAIYAEFEAAVAIGTARVLQGGLPRRASSMVSEWATIHRDELLRNWEAAVAGEPLFPIPPLE
jgi:hypothetical protein